MKIYFCQKICFVLTQGKMLPSFLHSHCYKNKQLMRGSNDCSGHCIHQVGVFFFFSIYFIYLKCRVAEGGRGQETESTSLYLLSVQMAASQPGAMRHVLRLGLPCGWQRSKNLGYFSLSSPQVH